MAEGTESKKLVWNILGAFSHSFSDIGKTLGFKPEGQERILETSLVQKGGFIKARRQDPWAERAVLGS